jgi:hypothetical protein
MLAKRGFSLTVSQLVVIILLLTSSVVNIEEGQLKRLLLEQ